MKRLLKPQSLLAAFIVLIAGLCFYAKATTMCPTAYGKWQGIGNEPSVSWAVYLTFRCCGSDWPGWEQHIHTNYLATQGQITWGDLVDLSQTTQGCEGYVDDAYEWHQCPSNHPATYYYVGTFGPGQCNTTTELICSWHAWALCDGQYGGGTNRQDVWDYGYRLSQGGYYGRTNFICQFAYQGFCGTNCANASLSSGSASASSGNCQ